MGKDAGLLTFFGKDGDILKAGKKAKAELRQQFQEMFKVSGEITGGKSVFALGVDKDTFEKVSKQFEGLKKKREELFDAKARKMQGDTDPELDANIATLEKQIKTMESSKDVLSDYFRTVEDGKATYSGFNASVKEGIVTLTQSKEGTRALFEEMIKLGDESGSFTDKQNQFLAVIKESVPEMGNWIDANRDMFVGFEMDKVAVDGDTTALGVNTAATVNSAAAKRGATVATRAQTASTIAETVATKALTAARAAMNAVMTMGISFIATAVISAATTAISNLVKANELAIEKAEELHRKYQEADKKLKDNRETVKSLSEEYERLSRGVNEHGVTVETIAPFVVKAA
jgi:flagellar biosynthesis chaperone FliJ